MSASTSRSYPRHSHDQYGIGVVDRGGHSSWSGRGQVEARAGELICCNPGEVTDGRSIRTGSRSWRMLYLEPEVMRVLCEDVVQKESGEFNFAQPVFLCEPTRALFDRAFAQTDQAESAFDVMSCETALLSLVARLHSNSTCPAREPKGPVGPIQRARDRIDADPGAAVTLSDLAAEAGLSRLQLLRAFAVQLGVTPHAYIVQRRLELARRLIREARPIAEVAVIAGFYDQPHLTRWFVRKFGVTPRRYSSRLR